MTKKELFYWRKLNISSCSSREKYLELREMFKEMYNEKLTEKENLENLEIILLYKEIM